MLSAFNHDTTAMTEYSSSVPYLHTGDVFLQGLLERGHRQSGQGRLVLIHLPRLVLLLPLWGELRELDLTTHLTVCPTAVKVGGH